MGEQAPHRKFNYFRGDPCAGYENGTVTDIDPNAATRIRDFIYDSRSLFNKENIGVKEIKSLP